MSGDSIGIGTMRASNCRMSAYDILTTGYWRHGMIVSGPRGWYDGCAHKLQDEVVENNRNEEKQNEGNNSVNFWRHVKRSRRGPLEARLGDDGKGEVVGNVEGGDGNEQTKNWIEQFGAL